MLVCAALSVLSAASAWLMVERKARSSCPR